MNTTPTPQSDTPKTDAAWDALERRACERCGGWHGGKGHLCYKCENMKSGDQYGAYWLHPDGWFRLFPPNIQVSHQGRSPQVGSSFRKRIDGSPRASV